MALVRLNHCVQEQALAAKSSLQPATSTPHSSKAARSAASDPPVFIPDSPPTPKAALSALQPTQTNGRGADGILPSLPGPSTCLQPGGTLRSNEQAAGLVTPQANAGGWHSAQATSAPGMQPGCSSAGNSCNSGPAPPPATLPMPMPALQSCNAAPAHAAMHPHGPHLSAQDSNLCHVPGQHSRTLPASAPPAGCWRTPGPSRLGPLGQPLDAHAASTTRLAVPRQGLAAHFHSTTGPAQPGASHQWSTLHAPGSHANMPVAHQLPAQKKHKSAPSGGGISSTIQQWDQAQASPGQPSLPAAPTHGPSQATAAAAHMPHSSAQPQHQQACATDQMSVVSRPIADGPQPADPGSQPGPTGLQKEPAALEWQAVDCSGLKQLLSHGALQSWLQEDLQVFKSWLLQLDEVAAKVSLAILQCEKR